jgi:putative FmdB family regulatory protein
MPLYEYTCQKCRHTFETLVYDGETIECPQCQSVKVDRLLSLPGLAKVGSSSSSLPSACNSEGPPCGAPWCRRS